MQVKNCTLINPLHCTKEANVVEVAKILRNNKQRRIIVIDENQYPVGIISTTDINNKVVAENKDASALKAHDIMTTPVYIVCDYEEHLNEIFSKMLHHESFFCPVTKKKRIYGVLTYGELIKHVHQKHGTG